MKEIFNRRSIRKFKNQDIEPEKLDSLVRAAMQAPSAANQQPWEFIVVRDKETLNSLAQTSPYAKPVETSGCTIVLLANENELKIPSAWEQDMSAAAQNILLEAAYLELGAVWIGVATSELVKENVSKLFQLPKQILPFAFIAVGYPDGGKNEFVDRYIENRVHYEKW